METVDSRLRVRLSVGLLCFLLAVPLAGCAGQAGPTPVSVVDGGTAMPVDPAEVEKASRLALAAYAGYLEAARKASGVPDPMAPELRKYLADPLLTKVRLGIRELDDKGAIRTGRLTSNPTVAEVDLVSNPKTVLIQDCIDATDYKMVYKKDKSKVPGPSSGRYVATATASFYPKDGWLIYDGASYPDQPC